MSFVRYSFYYHLMYVINSALFFFLMNSVKRYWALEMELYKSSLLFITIINCLDGVD